MNSLHILYEGITNGYRPEILNIISVVAILSGVSVIISNNPIVSVLFLIGLFLSIASYLIVLGLNFIGLSYLLVYVGAVSILFLFILMLINIRVSELLHNTTNGTGLAIGLTILFISPMYYILPYNVSISNINKSNEFGLSLLNSIFNIDTIKEVFRSQESRLNHKVSFVTSDIWDSNMIEYTHISSLGNIMYTSYSIWLIITSIILLLAMVGAIVITIKKV